jgi:hypothetical protein
MFGLELSIWVGAGSGNDPPSLGDPSASSRSYRKRFLTSAAATAAPSFCLLPYWIWDEIQIKAAFACFRSSDKTCLIFVSTSSVIARSIWIVDQLGWRTATLSRQEDDIRDQPAHPGFMRAVALAD